MDGVGKWLMLVGAGVMALGALVWFAQFVLGVRLGRLPGDIVVERQGFTFYFPIMTMLLISAVATLLLWLASSFRR